MLVLVLHAMAGATAGAIFRIQTLLLLALFVLVEAACEGIASGATAGLLWGAIAEVALQLGYVGGGVLRSSFQQLLGQVDYRPSRGR